MTQKQDPTGRPHPSEDCAVVIDAFLDAAIDFGIHQVECHGADNVHIMALDIMTAAAFEGDENGMNLRSFLRDRLRQRGLL